MGAGRKVPVAIAHDYLTQRGGAERVVLAMSRAFPDAPIYTMLYDRDGTFPEFRDRHVIASPLNHIPALRQDHRRALPFLAAAASAKKIHADVTLASSSGWAHGFRTTGRLLVYCHNPARWLYQSDEYLGEAGRRSHRARALAVLSWPLRRWDAAAAGKVDRYLANSSTVKQRIAHTYGIEADVLPPPPGLDVAGDQDVHPELGEWAGHGFWLVVSRLLPYKNVDKAIAAFRGRPGDHLVVVGDGPQREELRASLPENVRIVSGVSDAELRWIYAHASGLVAPSMEDFGLTPLEANGWGLPVVALRKGGYLDTVVDGQTGLFFHESEPELIDAAVERATTHEWSRETLIRHAAAFGEERFAAQIRDEVKAMAP
jgi:glycosyltransferase involved in cell wall biosynthesis